MPTILQNHYVLAVHDIRKSAQFYVDVLGFAISSEHPGWIFVQKDHCMIMLGECPDERPASELNDHSYFAYLRVDQVDRYFEQVRNSSAESIHPPMDKPWGMREFGITTPDGHRIMIGQIIAR